MLELPSGDMLPESGIISQYGMDINQGEGIELIPSDAVVAAKMRVKMEGFLPKYLSIIFKVLGQYRKECTEEDLDNFIANTLPEWEAMVTETEGDWLMGTDDITQLDIWVAPCWELLFLTFTACDLRADDAAKVNVRETAPNWCNYVERWREHPAIKPNCFNVKAFNK